MSSTESRRIDCLATLRFFACLAVAGCAGNGNGSSVGGMGGNPVETGGAGGGAGGSAATTATGATGDDVATGGVASTGGLPGTGGNSATGGNGGTDSVRDAAVPRDATSTGGATGTGGVTTGDASGSTAAPGKIFSQCRFHFGTTAAKGTLVAQLDFFTPGWMLGTFNQKSVCTNTNPGGSLAGLVPVDVVYIAANYVKNKYHLCDCNVTTCGTTVPDGGGTGRANDLCNYGAQYIAQDWTDILAQYTSNSTGFAACLSGRPIIFEMEPDWYQYAGGGETQKWTAAQAGTYMTAAVNALKSSLPNAVFSMDISPWIPNNGANWYPNFDMTLFTFINTSGGGTDANNVKIRANNNMTWAGVSQVTGKPILADTGYGAAGAPAGEDAIWNDPNNINARMLDGVVSISQYSPSATWGDTIASIRSQLNPPPNCY